MRSSSSPYLADLLAISLRWMALFGLTISLGVSGMLTAPGNAIPFSLTLLILTLSALWNGFVSVLATFNRRLPWHRPVNLLLDALIAIFLFTETGGLFGPVPWVGLLPLFSAGVYYETRGAFGVALIISLLQIISSFLMQGNSSQAIPAALLISANIVGAGIVSTLSAPLLNSLRNSYKSTVSERKEGERSAQRQERDRMRALFEMIETLSSTLNYQTVLETALDTAIDTLNDRSESGEEMVGAVLLFNDQHNLQVSAERHFISRDLNIDLPADNGVLHNSLQSGEMQLLADPGNDAELNKLATLHGKQQALCLPLIRGMNAFGVMLFAHADAQFFSQDRIETLQMLGNQAVIALQNARLYQDLAREKERIVQMQEDAQKKLARDLHDGPTQSISAIAMRINIARKLLERAPKDPAVKETSEELVKVEELARRTTQEIRHMLFTLRPLILESEGLLAALNTIAAKMKELYQQKVIVEADADVLYRLNSNHQTVIFYLTEEAVNNARKHAQANEIWVRIRCVPNVDDIALLEIVDNGIGFDVQSVMDSYDRRGSLGMINLRERTDQMNGLLKIDSVPGNGTRIRVFIPLNEQAADRLHRW